LPQSFLGRILLENIGAWIEDFSCIIGHIYPVFFQFKGGKGVLIIGRDNAGLCRLPLFLIGNSIFYFNHADQKDGVLFLHIRSRCINPLRLDFPMPLYQKIMTTAIALLVIMKHKDNIIRLLNGTEPETTLKRGCKDGKNYSNGFRRLGDGYFSDAVQPWA
jgi:glycerol-3-phosphate acyltransferase PlsY